MSPIQQMLLGVGAVATKTYVDDVFNTYVYTGNGGAHQITNGVDNTKGALVWFKNRSIPNSIYADHNTLIDTVRGGTKYVMSNRNDAEDTDTNGNLINTFNNNGFTLQGGGKTNATNSTYVAWNFRKSPGFFDVVTWTGNGSNRTISHSLGSVPGMIFVKSLDDGSEWWAVYNRQLNGGTNPEQYYLRLNDTNAEATSSDLWNNTAPTSTNFSLGTGNAVNKNGDDYVAYIFAGGESTAATARSVDFDGTGDDLTLASSTDLDMGTGDFTVEFWYKGDSDSGSYRQTVIAQNTGWGSGFNQIRTSDSFHGVNKIVIFDYDADSSDALYESNGTYPPNGQWRHVAVVRASGVLYVYVDGILDGSKSYTGSFDLSESNGTMIGHNPGDAGYRGNISNLRVVKGTAVYTSSFKPPTEPLTNITNTKLLCCNNSSVTGSTVTPGTITANGDPTASTDSPFDDPAGFVFGENEDQNVIKCGSFIASAGSPYTVNVGFEPQWVLIKRSGTLIGDWTIIDNIRGWVADTSSSETKRLLANSDGAEDGVADMSGLTSTGFTVDDGGIVNQSGHNYIYMAIRRPDGYVGKPADAGTDVFAMDTGNSSSTEAFTSGFPVDYVISTNPSSTSVYNLETGGRLIQGKYLYTHNSDAEASHANFDFTSNTGWSKNSGYNSSYQAWMWKRHAGFDVVTYKGDGVAGRQVPHSLNKTVEMVWIKKRSETGNWIVGHKGMNGGTNPWQYSMQLDSTDASNDNEWAFNDTAPTSTAITLGTDGNCNGSGKDYLMMLFASTDVSKVGSYTGNGSTQTITTGFSPRFILFKNSSSGGSYATWSNWYVYDTLRGIPASGTVNYLLLNKSIAEEGGDDLIDVSSTGFTINVSYDSHNGSGESYIYYAHA